MSELTVPPMTNIEASEARPVENVDKPLGMKLVNSRKATIFSDPNDLVELAKAVQHGSESVKFNASNRLRVIADQIRYLQEQAAKVLKEARRDADLHHAACNMVKKPGTVYHLYRKSSGQTYLSILSPQEWGNSCPNKYLGTYRLNYDSSWTSAEDLETREQEDSLVNKVLNAQLALPSTLEILENKQILSGIAE